jgi:hypothetical protein
MLVVAIVPTIMPVTSCYFTFAQMPSPYNVTVDSAKNIYIDKSLIAIWGRKRFGHLQAKGKMIEICKIIKK